MQTVATVPDQTRHQGAHCFWRHHCQWSATIPLVFRTKRLLHTARQPLVERSYRWGCSRVLTWLGCLSRCRLHHNMFGCVGRMIHRSTFERAPPTQSSLCFFFLLGIDRQPRLPIICCIVKQGSTPPTLDLMPTLLAVHEHLMLACKMYGASLPAADQNSLVDGVLSSLGLESSRDTKASIQRICMCFHRTGLWID